MSQQPDSHTHRDTQNAGAHGPAYRAALNLLLEDEEATPEEVEAAALEAAGPGADWVAVWGAVVAALQMADDLA